MDIELLSKMVKELILSNDRVSLPGLGTFVADMVPASFSDRGYTINPPYRRLGFRSGSNKEGDRLLVELYASANKVGEDLAGKVITSFVDDIAAELKAKKAVSFPGLGRMRLTREGVAFFVPDENLDIYPEGFGLEPISLKSRTKPTSFDFSSLTIDAPVAPVAPVVAEPAAAAAAVGTDDWREGISPETCPRDGDGTDGPSTEPEPVEPAPVDPISVEPASVEPEPVEPVAVEPEVVEPVEIEPEPVAAEPAAAAAAVGTDDGREGITPETCPRDSDGTDGPSTEPATAAETPTSAEPIAASETPTAAEAAAPALAEIERTSLWKKGWFVTLIVILSIIALVAIAFGVFMLMAKYAPDTLDKLLYTKEELYIINHK